MVFEPADPPHHLRKIQCLDGNSCRLQDFFAVADGVERRRPGPNRPNPQPLQSLYHPAYRQKPLQVVAKLLRTRCFGMQCSQRIRNSVLRKVVARGHFSAETVAPVSNGHLGRRVRRGLHQHRHAEVRHPQRFGNGTLIAEVRQRHDDAVDFLSMLLKQLRATRGLLPRLHGAILGIAFPEKDGFDALGVERSDHLLPARTRQMVREKAAVANKDTEHHRWIGRFCHGFARGDFCKRLQCRTYCALSNLVKLALPLSPFFDDLDCAQV